MTQHNELQLWVRRSVGGKTNVLVGRIQILGAFANIWFKLNYVCDESEIAICLTHFSLKAVNFSALSVSNILGSSRKVFSLLMMFYAKQRASFKSGTSEVYLHSKAYKIWRTFSSNGVMRKEAEMWTFNYRELWVQSWIILYARLVCRHIAL